MKLEYLILGLLEITPQTGYDLKKFMDTEGRFVSASRPLSQIYTTLKKMVEKDWVHFDEAHRDGKPDLKIYHTTPTGRQVFTDYLRKPIKLAFRYRESDIYIRTMFSFLVEPEVILNQLHTELDYRKKQISQFRNRDRTLHSTQLPMSTVAEANELYEMLHCFGARAIDDYVRSLEELIEFFEQQKAINH